MIGGIYFYRTYALYTEKKEFNVLKGVIPDFRKSYTEEILNGADPVLADGLIPVEINETGKVIKANIKEKWYSYANKKWANAVILTGEDTYQPGDIIQEDKIESYFVWIPKYSYQLWDLGNYPKATNLDTKKIHTIPVKFGLNNTNDANDGECTTPMTSGASGNCKVGDYMTPPAFISMGTNGLWVGKFETGYKKSNTNISDSTNIQIKPNIYAWCIIQVSNAYSASFNYKRELDSHMMKNTEWGAVAYLQHSEYGSATGVRRNNNQAFITGYAAVSEPTLIYSGDSRDGNRYESTVPKKDGTYTVNYLNSKSQVASTTGNYSGIYDMNGGAREYMMGVLGSLNAGTGISFAVENKYYDLYTVSTDKKFSNSRILGDATTEFGPFAMLADSDGAKRAVGTWYNDLFLYEVNVNFPWIGRGGIGYHGTISGIFTFETADGSATYNNKSFRVVLAI